MQPTTILIVEDEAALRETIEYNLQREGYAVITAADGEIGLDLARQHAPDMILLDIMLPGLDGIELCRILRKETNVPILFLTARDEEIDKIVGLEMGADDYMVKPFSMRELMSRVKALLRRVRMDIEDSGNYLPEPKKPLVSKNIRIDPKRREVFIRDTLLVLKPKEYDLLLYLFRNQDQVLTRDHLLEKVWGWSYGGGSRTVDVHIRWLREKIEADPSNPVRIITLRGVGYRFEG